MFFKKLSRKKRNYLNLLIGGLLVVLIPLALSTFRNPDKAQASWYNDNWAYRKAVTVTVTSNSSDITNLQTLLTVDTTGITANLQTNCEDLRFTNAGGKLLPYYIDTCSDNSATNKIWVQADLVPKNTTTYTMYMYYGNPSATSASDSNKFNLFNGLIGYLNMNESSWNTTPGEIKDLSISAFNGTAGGSAAITTGQTGYGNAGSLNGTTDYIDGGANYNFTSENFTISFWLKLNSFSSDVGGQGPVILYKGAWQTNGYYSQVQSNGAFFISTNQSGANQTTGTIASALTLATWQQITYVRNGAQIKIYVNGIDKTSGAGGTHINPTSSSDNLRLGLYTASSIHTNGYFDELKVYNRALSATEVSQLYSNPGSIANVISTNAKPSTSFATEEKAPGPIAYWQFDEGTGTTTQDATANNNDGTISGATWQTEDQCISGKCLFFDGTDDHVLMTNAPTTGTGSFSAFAWVRTSDTGARKQIFMWGNDAVASNDGAWLFINTSNQLAFDLSNVAGTTSTTTITDGKWHFVGVVNSANTIQLYIDGKADGSSVSMSPNLGSTYKVIGKRGSASSWFFKGFIDEPKIYNFARSAAQVLTDYNSRGSVKGSSTNLGGNTETMKQLSNGLVGYWKMDESSWTNNCSTGSVLDSSGNGNNGKACPNSTGPTGGAVGKFGNAGSFNGTDNYVSIPTASFSNPAAAITVSSWVKITTNKNWNGIVVRDSWITSGKNSWNIFTNVNGTASFGVSEDTSQFVSSSSTNLSTGVWYHLVGTYDGADAKIYVNGVLSGTRAKAGLTFSSLTGLSIGSTDGIGQFFDGTLDEVRIYNRALSPADVSTLYTFAPGPVGYWNMDENAGTSANDTSGNANTGTWNGSTTHWKPGKYGSSGNINGGTDYVSVTDPGTSVLDVTGTITVSAWVKAQSTSISWHGLVTKYSYAAPSGGNAQGWGLFFAPGNKYRFTLTNTQDPTVAGQYADSTTSVSTSWTYITGTYDGTSIRMYVNGVLESTVTANSSVLAANTFNFLMGSYYNNNGGDVVASNYLNSLDDVKIYNYARTQKQITEDMNAGHPAVGSPVGSAIGHWDFDEGFGTTTNNYGNQGSTLNGTMSGFASPATATSGWTNSGKFGKGLLFDGNNDYVNLGTNTSTNFGSTNDFTLSAWIYPTTLNTYNTIISRRVNSPSIQGYHLFVRSTGVINFSSFNGGSLVDSLNTNTGIISTNNWYHVVLTHASGGNTTIYVNGVSVLSQTTGSGDFSTSTTASLIGAQAPSALQDFFTGTMDEVKVYNYALTADEVKVDMNRGSSQVLGALSDSSSLSNQAAGQEYCVPGDSTSCTAPVGRWDFEEGGGITVNDTSGNANTGTWNGTGTKHWVPRKEGMSGNFNGSSDYVDAGGNSNLNITTTMTIEAWIKTSSTGINTVVSKTDVGGPWNGYVMSIGRNTAGDLSYWPGNYSSYAWLSSNSTNYNDGKWHHIAIVHSGTTVTFYKDSISDGSPTVGARTNNSSTNLQIGKENATTNYFNGQIDQVRIFNYARTPAQIAWDYNRGAPVGHWKFDECQGSVAHDSADPAAGGTRNDGTITPGSGGQTSVGTCTGSAGTLWADGATGKYNGSLAFDGTDDYVSVTDNSILDFGASQDFTVAAWVKTTQSPGGSSWPMIISKEVAASRTGYNFYLEASGNGIVGFDNFVATALQGPVLSTTRVNDGNWHFVVGQRTGTSLKIYVDGRLEDTENGITAGDLGNSGNLTIGMFRNGTLYPFTGQIDDVKIFNYALTATQVKGLYNNGAVKFAPVTGTP